MNIINIMQGDQYEIEFKLTDSDGEILAPPDVTDVEIVLGQLVKNVSTGVHYNDNTQTWNFPVTQSETIDLSTSLQKAQVRIKFVTGDVVGVRLQGIDIVSSLSKELL